MFVTSNRAVSRNQDGITRLQKDIAMLPTHPFAPFPHQNQRRRFQRNAAGKQRLGLQNAGGAANMLAATYFSCRFVDVHAELPGV